jgi:uncharacterized protein YjbI with pentapeptide repeats
MSRTFTADELKQILDDHSKWVRGVSGGQRADLYGADLRDANLRDANLYGANLRDANLYGADLYGAYLRDANLYGADLSGANLRGANLSGADLYGADLSGADLYGANLSGANLRGANLRDANLSGANLRGANLYGADLSGADLYGADLYGANLRDANLRDAQHIPVLHCSVLPDEGEFICYKKVTGNVVLTLLVPEYAARITPYSDRKSRVSHAIPLKAERDGKTISETDFKSLHDSSFIYRIGELAECKNFNGDRTKVCTTGLHVYATKAEAREHQ